MTHRKHIVFDWGDTLMKDDRSRNDAMYLWPEVHAMDGAETTLRKNILLTEKAVAQVKYTETEHYAVTREFLNKHESMLRQLLDVRMKGHV